MIALHILALLAAATSEVPLENQVKGERPPLAPAEAMARRLLDAIEADDPAAVSGDFFPAEPFDALKAIAKPGDYRRQLLKWYEADVHKEHARVKGLGKLSFDSFRAGGCVWKAVNTEANKIPYWSCYGNHFVARTADGKKVDFALRAMINWGKSWYVTHLLPIPKA